MICEKLDPASEQVVTEPFRAYKTITLSLLDHTVLMF